jgi:hypothetical protein
MMRGPGPNDERFIEEVDAGRFSVDAQGRIWRHIMFNQPAEPQRAEYRLKSGFLRVLWHDGRSYCVRARNAVWRYFYGPVPEDARANLTPFASISTRCATWQMRCVRWLRRQQGLWQGMRRSLMTGILPDRQDSQRRTR